MKKILLAAALACAPIGSAGAQYLVDGTTPDGSGGGIVMPTYGDGWFQTFTARGTALSRVSLWFYGGSLSGDPLEYDFFSWFGLYRAGVGNGVTMHFSQLSQGRVDFDFDTPFATTIGAQYTIQVWTGSCEIARLGGCGTAGGIGAPTTGVFRQPQIGTTMDAYDGGFAYNYSETVFTGPVDTGRDLSFELTYSAVPEPSTYVLMLGGLGALGLVALRRRSV